MAPGVYLVRMKYIRKDGLKMGAGIFGPRGLSPPKSKTRWRRRTKTQNKMAAKGEKQDDVDGSKVARLD